MSTRQEIIGSFYSESREDTRLSRSRHGQLEYHTTMAFIHRYAARDGRPAEKRGQDLGMLLDLPFPGDGMRTRAGKNLSPRGASAMHKNLLCFPQIRCLPDRPDFPRSSCLFTSLA